MVESMYSSWTVSPFFFRQSVVCWKCVCRWLGVNCIRTWIEWRAESINILRIIYILVWCWWIYQNMLDSYWSHMSHCVILITKSSFKAECLLVLVFMQLKLFNAFGFSNLFEDVFILTVLDVVVYWCESEC